jgi:HK97 family phage major capsid protein
VSGGKPVRSIGGVPVYLSSQLAAATTSGSATDCGNAYVYQADQVVVVQRDKLRFESSADVLFGTDQVAFRGICRFDLVVPNPNAVLKITGLSISNTAHG